jgi:hypothetical protein
MMRPFLIVAALSVGAATASTRVQPASPAGSTARAALGATATMDGAVYIVYFWRARPGKAAEYSQYIRTIAEPIDEEARKAGVFEEVHTYTPAFATGAPGADWTHMRVFTLKNFAALDAFSAGMDAATHRMYPDDKTRPRSDDLRDLARQEVWRSLP